MRVLKNLTVAIVIFTMMATYIPVSALELGDLKDFETEQELRLAIAGDELWKENYPNGLFNFIGGKFSVEENKEFYEFAIARQGGTTGEASVELKVVDVSAKYGEDYVIRVYDSDKRSEGTDIPQDPNSVPLMESLGDDPQTNISVDEKSDEGTNDGKDIVDVVLDNIPDDKETSDNIPSDKEASDNIPSDTETSDNSSGNGDETSKGELDKESTELSEMLSANTGEVNTKDTQNGGVGAPSGTLADGQKDTLTGTPSDGQTGTLPDEQTGTPADGQKDTSTGTPSDEQANTSEELNDNEPEELPYTQLTPTGLESGVASLGKLTLRRVKEAYTGVASDRPTWKQADASTVENLKSAYDEVLGDVPGASGIINFADGEYIKYLRIIPVNHSKPSGDRQSLLVLQNPTGGASRGECYTATLEILDDKDREPGTFEFGDTSVTANGDKAAVTVLRKGNLVDTESVFIGTEEGTAKSGMDYAPGLKELTFTPGMSKQTVYVDILPNLYRNTPREFVIALDRENIRTNPSKASCVVTVPSGNGAKSVDEINALINTASQDIRYSADTANSVDISPRANVIGAYNGSEMISRYGYSNWDGYWMMSAKDFYNGDRGKSAYANNNGQLYFIHRGGSSYAYDIVTKLYGVKEVRYEVSNHGNGRDWMSWFTKYHEDNYKISLVVRAPNQKDISQTDKGYMKNMSGKRLQIPEKMWNTTEIGFYSWAASDNDTSPVIGPVELELIRYNAKILAADNFTLDTYTLSGGNLVKKTTGSGRSPGTMKFASIESSVRQSQSNINGTSANVYRSELIKFNVEYDKTHNPGGKYAQYVGFRIKNGNSWIEYRTYEAHLRLDSNFFEKSGMLNAIRAGTIEIQPIFVRCPATVIMKRGQSVVHYEQLGAGTDSKTFNNAFVGDTITSIKALGNSLSITPSFSAKNGYTDYYYSIKNCPDAIINKADTEGTVIDFELNDRYNELNLSFKNPNMQVKADPDVYSVYPSKPVYKVDNVTYTSHGAFMKKMTDVFSKGQNPKIEVSFDCLYDSAFTAAEHKRRTGTPYEAMLKVYKSDSTERKTHTIPYNNGFKLSGYLNDLGWEDGDYATVTINGKTVSSEVKISRETAIDFLTNTRDGIIMKSPDGKITTGDIYTPINVADAGPTSEYELTAIPNGNSIARWADFSPDENGDGAVEPAERQSALKKLQALGFSGTSLNDVYDSTQYYGNAFYAKPSFFTSTKLYYDFVKKEGGGDGATIWVKLNQVGGTVLDPTIKGTPRPIRGASVVVGDTQLTYDDQSNDGSYYHYDKMYEKLKNYLGKVYLHPYVYNFKVQPGIASQVDINTSEVMPPINFKASVDGKNVDFNKVENGAKIRTVDVVNKNTTFSFGFDSKYTGITPNKAIIRIYGRDDVEKKSYNEDAGATNTFKLTINTVDQGIAPGDYMSIAGVYDDGNSSQEFPEVFVGFTFSKPLTLLNVLTSFDTPFAPALKLFGKISNNFDLGLNIDLTDKLEMSAFTDDIGRDRLLKTVSFGFNKDDVGKLIEKVKDEGMEADKESEDDPDAADTTPDIREQVEGADGKDDKTKAQNVAKDSQDTETAKSMGSGSGSTSFDFNVAITVVLEEGRRESKKVLGTYEPNGFNYFSALTLVATAEASAGYTYTYITPIGVPVTAFLEASGSAVLTFGVEADHTNPYSAKYEFGGDGSIGFNPGNYAIYTKFYLDPHITIGAGVGIDLINVMIYGKADMGFEFYMPVTDKAGKSSGNGGMTFSAEVAVKALWISKEWSLYKSDYISFFEYSKSSLINAFNDPYRDYSYKAVGEITDEDIITREYLDSKSDWLGLGIKPLSNRSIVGQNSGETKLFESAYPYPQTKLVEIDENTNMMLFIDDDPKLERDEKNRAVLKYTLGSGNSWEEPVIVDNDGTWDESPDAFVLDDKVLIVWSDASKEFDETDTETSMLMAMDISAKWFDISNRTLGGEINITKTTEGDAYADLSPMISASDDLEDIMLYYTKIDYEYTTARHIAEVDLSDAYDVLEDGLDGGELLYGDLINGYNVIAYRKAEKQGGDYVWNDEYTAEEIEEMNTNPDGGNFNGEELKAQFYGQRFLDLAVPATIKETKTPTTAALEGSSVYEHDEPNATKSYDHDVVIGYNISQTAIYDDKNPIDPRVVYSDLISYNDLGLYAYTIDLDANLKTTHDQRLYLQIYNYEQNEFHHPVLLTNRDGHNAKPQFVRSKGITYLYWLQDGNIVYMDISSLVSSDEGLIELDVLGAPSGRAAKVYVINKEDSMDENGNDRVETAIAAKQDKPIADFDVASNESGVYIVWTDYCLSYKNGIKNGDEGSGDANNIIKEKQLFAAYSSPTIQRSIKTTNQKPNEYTGPEQDVYTCAVWETVDGFDWSSPVQITFEQGASYSDISFVVTKSDDLLVSYIKYKQELNENGVFVDKETGRTLAISSIAAKSDLELGDIGFIASQVYETSDETGQVDTSASAINTGEFVYQRGSISTAKMSIFNAGVKPLEDVEYQTFVKKGKTETTTGAWNYIDSDFKMIITEEAIDASSGDVITVDVMDGSTLLGGTDVDIYGEFIIDEELSDVSIGFRVRAEGISPIEVVKPLNAKEDIGITVNQIIQTGEHSANVNLTLRNTGNLDFNGDLDIGGVYRENISLNVGEQKDFNVDIDISSLSFSAPVTTDEGTKDAMTIAISAGQTTVTHDIARFVNKEVSDAMENISEFALTLDGKKLADNAKISMLPTEFKQIVPRVSRTNPVADDSTDSAIIITEVVYKSSNPDVVSVLDDGMIIPLGTGKATLTAFLKPAMPKIIAENPPEIDEGNQVVAGSMLGYKEADNLYELPSGMIKSKSIELSVTTGSSGGGGGKTNDATTGGETGTTPEPQYISTTATTDDSGKATATVSVSDIKAAADKIGGQSGGVIALRAELAEGVNAGDIKQVQMAVPEEGLTYMDSNQEISIKFETPLSTITFDAKAMDTVKDAGGGDMTLSVTTIDKQELNISQDELEMIGDRPIYDFTVMKGDTKVSNFEGGKVTISIPYTPAEGENLQSIVLYHIDSDGKLKTMRGRYDEASGCVVAVVTHFSQFAVGHNPVVFADVQSGYSYKQAIDFVAARGIAAGIGNNLFGGDRDITRAQFLVMIMRAYGIEPESGTSDNFADAGNTYYTDYLATAKSLGIASGSGNNRFAPERSLTRQEMFQLIYNTLNIIDELPEIDSDAKKVGEYADESEIDSWAKVAMTALVESGTIVGNGINLMPAGRASRAQMSQVIYNLLGR